MISIVLAGASALVWGVADFCGGKAVQEGDSSHRQALSVTVLSQLSAVPMIALFLVLVPGSPGVSALVLGGLAGVADLFGIVLLYQGLSSGSMAVVAPTTAVTAAVVPLTGGLLLGERPGPAALTGAGIAVIAILLLSLGSTVRRGPLNLRPLWYALASGAFFGIYFMLLKYAGEGGSSGIWPLAAARATAIPLGLTIMLFLPVGRRLLPNRQIWRFTIFAGVLDTLANGFYLLAVQDGAVSVVAPVASLYPATTVILALLIHKERLRSMQMVGLGLAAASLVLAAS